MSRALIIPRDISGTDVRPEGIADAARQYRSAATAIEDESVAVNLSWSALSGFYESPDSPQLLASMRPVASDSRVIAHRLTSMAGLLDTLASEIAEPVRRLKELQGEAEEFVESVEGGIPSGRDSGVEYSYTDLGPTPWDKHGPSIDRNYELQAQVSSEVQKLLAAQADFVNGVRSLHDDGDDLPVEETPTLAQVYLSQDNPWSPADDTERTSRSMAMGFTDFAMGIITGVAGLGGFDMANAKGFDLGFMGAAWGSVASGLGALVVPAMAPWLPVLTYYVPDEYVPEPWHGATDWYRGTMDAFRGSLVGTPEQWEEDPVAAGSFAVLSIGTIFVPGVGIAGAGTKAASALSRTGAAAERLSGAAATGSRLANGLSRTGDIFATVSEAVAKLDGLARGGSAGQPGGDILDIPDVAPDNLTRSLDDADWAPDIDDVAHRADDSPASAISPQDLGKIERYEQLAERIPPLSQMFEGSIFNLENHHRYEFNEIYLDVTESLPDGTTEVRRTRIDSFTDGEAVVSRKNTQLADVNYSTAKGYVDEFTRKYSANDVTTTIADTPTNRQLMPDLVGEPMSGRMYLEVPEQHRPIPPEIVAYAADKGIEIIIAPNG